MRFPMQESRPFEFGHPPSGFGAPAPPTSTSTPNSGGVMSSLGGVAVQFGGPGGRGISFTTFGPGGEVLNPKP